MNKTAIIDLQYLSSIEYFTVLLKYEHIILEVNEHFEKQTFRNRCHILGANKIDVLTVPVIGGRKKILFKDIRIDYDQKWLNNHWRAITSAYGRAPFFEFFESYFEKIFFKKEPLLMDLNYGLLTLCLELLKIKADLSFSEKYQKGSELLETDDLRSIIHPKKDSSQNSYYRPVEYTQVFGNNFVANLSIIDLLFCEGPGAKGVVTKSIRNEMNK